MDKYWHWSAVSAKPIPSVALSELSDASNQWVEERGLSRELPKEEKGQPATQEQCRLLAERIWRHEFQLQGLISHVQLLMNGDKGESSKVVQDYASVHSLNVLSQHVHQQLDAIEFRQSQQDIILNELSKLLDLGTRHDQQEQRVNTLFEHMQSHSARHEEHLTRFDALSQKLEGKQGTAIRDYSEHEQAFSQSLTDLTDRIKELEQMNQKPARLSVTTDADAEDGYHVRQILAEVEESPQAIGKVTPTQQEVKTAASASATVIDALVHDKSFGTPSGSGSMVEKKMTSSKAVGSRQSVQALNREELDHVVSAYTLQESVWDVIVFAGFPSVGYRHSALILFAAIVNLVTQCLFCLVITFNMTYNELTDLVMDTFMLWRATEGHNAFSSYYRQPLAAQLCGNNLGGMSSATTQFSTHHDIRSFLINPYSPLLSGKVSAILCTMVWFFAVMKDVLHLTKYCVALLSLRRGKAKIGVHGAQEFEITSLSHLQLGLILTFSVIPRFIICVLLSVSGIYFLGYTRQLTELLLNAVALVFVLDLDELLYVVLVPRRVKLIMEHVKTLAKSKDHHRVNQWLGGTLFVVVWIAISVVVLTVVHFYHLQPFHERLLKIDAYLCNGNLNFEYVTNKATGVVMYSPTTPWKNDIAHTKTYQIQAVWELTGLDHRESQGPLPRATPVPVSGSRLSMENHMSVEESVNTLACEDLATSFLQERSSVWFNAHVDVLRWEIQDFNINYCQDVSEEACQMQETNQGLSKVRAICMTTCGCDNPWSGLFDTQGCSVKCEAKFEDSLRSMSEAPPLLRQYLANCSDPPTNLLIQDHAWQAYAKGLRSSVAQLYTQSAANQLHSLLVTRGCEAAAALRSAGSPGASNSVDLCYSIEPGMRSLRMWCPGSCKCKEETFRQIRSEGRECPDACQGGSDRVR